MSHDPHRPTSRARLHDAEVPPSLFSHDTGLTPQRLRELIAGEDAYAPRADARR